MKPILVKHLCFAGFVMIFMCGNLQAQDTSRITLHQAESIFMQKNLQLLAEKYNIDIADAQIMQAKYYPNPNFSVTANAYDPLNKKVFNVSNKTGQYQVDLQQLIRLAGKRNKEVGLAAIGKEQSAARFYDLLRSLEFSLRTTFADMFFLQKSISAYDKQIVYLKDLDAAYEQLQKKDVVTMKDAVRIKSLYYSLKADRAALLDKLTDAQADMQILLQDNKTIFKADADEAEMNAIKPGNTSLTSLIDSAYANRADLKLAKQNVNFDTKNIAYQKALAVPDLTVGAHYDKRGSFVDNATFFSVAMDLPFFNRNKGNIKAAKLSLMQSRLQSDLTTSKVENDVQRAYTKVINADKNIAEIDPQFQKNYDALLKGVTDNFIKKNISLIEFTDFYESYRDNAVQMNQLMNDRIQSMEQLNFSIGKIIFNN